MRIIHKDSKIDTEYDFIFVGAGLFSATCCDFLDRIGRYKCLVIDQRSHIGGNCYTEWNDTAKCNVHKYGAHIFHTSDENVWKYVTSLVSFNNYVNQPIANYHGEIYNLPFNMNTFTKIFDNVSSIEEAKMRIKYERREDIKNPKNLEEQALSLVGETIYKKLIKEYTEKQWGRDCKDLPPEIIKRLPLRFTFNNNYFNDKHQGIPIRGYTDMIKKMFGCTDIILDCKFEEIKNKLKYKTLIYTGRIDEFFNYKYGKLDYRSLKFESEVIDRPDYQGNAVVNYTSHDEAYTRIVEHKHFEPFPTEQSDKTIITREYSIEASEEAEACYPINNERNTDLYEKYRSDADSLKDVFIEGRLGRYEYNDMDKTIKKALEFISDLITRRITNEAES